MKRIVVVALTLAALLGVQQTPAQAGTETNAVCTGGAGNCDADVNYIVSATLVASVTITVSDAGAFVGYGQADGSAINMGATIPANCSGGVSVGVPTNAQCYSANGNGKWLVTQASVVTSGVALASLEWTLTHSAGSTWEDVCIANSPGTWADGNTCAASGGASIAIGASSVAVPGAGTYNRDIAYRAGDGANQAATTHSGDMVFTVTGVPN